MEVLQRKALKMVLNIYNNTPNEILHIESGILPLKPLVYKRQLNFFHKIKNDTVINPLSSISRLVNEIIDTNLPFIRHYKKLDEKFENAIDCFNYYSNEEKLSLTSKTRIKGANEPDSIHGTY